MTERAPPTRDPAEIIEALLSGTLPREQALEQLRHSYVEDLGFARLDHDRAHRQGFPEVVFGPGKRPEQIAEIFARLAARHPNVLCTRTEAPAAQAEHDPRSGLLWLWRDRAVTGVGEVLVLSAGTSDEGVAQEALVCARVMGNEARLIADVGVAGLHRLLAHLDAIRSARVLIVVAGLDAALPSVVAGLVARPVIAVPTSVGYGTGAGGVAALLAALNACAGGVTAVNIDNGYGAARAATLMNRRDA
jgi:NCAIR mutase (PurE)-related protein